MVIIASLSFRVYPFYALPSLLLALINSVLLPISQDTMTSADFSASSKRN